MITETYLGGKGTQYPKIINQIRPHDVYVAPFLGRDKVIQNMRKARWVQGFELDVDIYQEWEAVPWMRAFHGNGLHYLKNFEPAAKLQHCLFCDPPYPHETRTSAHRYKHEFTERDHRLLLQHLNRIHRAYDNCQILVCTYPNWLYTHDLKGWHCIEYQAMTRGGPRTEHLYVNRLPDGELHDYSYLGINRTQRQQIKRKADRWTTNLERMPIIERNAILERILSNYRPDVPPPSGQLNLL